MSTGYIACPRCRPTSDLFVTGDLAAFVPRVRPVFSRANQRFASRRDFALDIGNQLACSVFAAVLRR